MSAPFQTQFTAAARFEAARQLDSMAPGHRARRLHGHGFLAQVRCTLPPAWADFPGGEVNRLRLDLQQAVAPLDYRLLNDRIALPGDANLARWIQMRLEAPGIALLGIRSAPDQGVDLDRAGRAHVWRRYQFQSAHRLPNVPAGHKCGRMHGHGFEAILHVRQGALPDGARPDAGLPDAGVPDYDQLDALWRPFQAQLDFACLNELQGLGNPTSEMLAGWLWARIQPALPELAWVTVYETASCGASFDGSRYRIWKEFTLDSALYLKRAPAGNPLRQLHGHTYTLRLHMSAPLDQVLGWTVDFGDVKELFNPLFRRLDHQPLHEIPGLEDCDTATLANWILAQGRAVLPQLDRVDLHESPGCGAIAFLTGHDPVLAI